MATGQHYPSLVRYAVSAGALVVGALGCSPREVTVGAQCPSPYSGASPVTAVDASRGADRPIFGTTCAPCDDDDGLQLDDEGCPVYVTFDSCGGDLCIGSVRLHKGPIDGGLPDAGDEDAGEEADEDGGA